VEVPLLLQFSIALFTGMVAATFVPPVRRSIPRPVEVLLWIALITVCALGTLSITDTNARELSASAAWGADQLINTMLGLLFGGVLAWLADNRFQLASWLIIVAGADLFVLVLLRSRRAANGWQPRVRLREWMELPVPVRTAYQPQVVSDPIAAVNRKIAAAMAIAGTTMLTNLLDLSIWVRDVMVPREVRRLAHAVNVSRMHSRASLESMRDATAHLQFAARAWYAAAGEPAVSGIAYRATEAVRGLKPANLTAGQVIDIQALLSAQSIGWYGPLSKGPTEPVEDGIDVVEPQRSDRLAS
jgi:hypothetical protein